MSDSPILPPSPQTSLSIVPFPPSSSAQSDPRFTSDSPRTRGKRLSITAKDRERWRKWKDGASAEEIAEKEHSKVLTVQNSIQKFLTYQSSVSHEAVDMAANELTIQTLQKVGELIDDVLRAEKDKTVTDAEGKMVVVQVPDLKMRMTVFDKITKLIQSVRKGDGGVNISNIGQQNNAVIVAGAGKGRSVEERIRALREKNNLKNDDEDEDEDDGVIDAEFEDEEDEEYEAGEGEYEEGEGDESGEVGQSDRGRESNEAPSA
jgi:hypothetical protein